MNRPARCSVSRLRRLCLALPALTLLAAPVPAQETETRKEDAGAYLAARQASIASDYRAATGYFARALTFDPGNAELLENATLAYLAVGDMDSAGVTAEQLQGMGNPSQIAAMTLLARAAAAEDWPGGLALMDNGASAGPLIDGIARAWALVGQGKMSEALAAFDAFAAEEGLKSLGLYHKALALASVGDFEGADRILSGDEAGPLRATRRGITAHAEVLSQLERNAEAMKLIDGVTDVVTGDGDPALMALRKRLEAGETLPFDVVRAPRDGMAEVFFSVASALSNDAEPVTVLVYSRIAQYLRPDLIDATLMSAGTLEAMQQFDLANETYNLVPREDPSFHVAELGRANVLVKADRTDAAIEVLEQLSKSHAQIPAVHITLGDLLRREERYAESTQAYDRAIALFKAPQPGQWPIYFARGITHEREKRWPEAEADLRRALELAPNQPQVLNYLGYSFLELNQNLDEALTMITRAVAARPDDGYITDSLGWAFYRMGRYQEAVTHMERAASLEPTDPIVNDHLGDVLWAVDRKVEAVFQWRRALSLDPTETDADRIRRKLEVGLDAVLAEEGAKPLAVSKNGE